MNPVDPIQDLFNRSLDLHKSGQLDKALPGYNALLNRNPYDAMILYLIGNVHLQRMDNGSAITFLEASIRNDEKLAGAWNDLGCALKAEHYDQAAAQAWEKAIAIEGETVGTVNNLATLYADSGYPDQALPYIDKAMQLDATNPHVHWNRALALLSKGVWEEGWKEHEYRLKIPNRNIGERAYGARWTGQTAGTLVIHGEQGLGDEIMFATCLPDFMAEFPNLRIVLEVEPRLKGLMSRSFDVPAYGSEAEAKEAGVQADYQLGIGSLAMRYRNRDEDFPARAALTPDPELVEQARELLAAFPRPWIGYSWMGGTKITRVHHRSLSAKAMMKLHPKGTAISLQYGELADIEADQAGLVRFGGWTDGKDLDKLAAFCAVLDDVVSVCTTLIHLTGAMGIPARVMTPLRSSWRYGIKSGPGAMAWYPQHTLYRQLTEGDWGPVTEDVKHDLKEKWDADHQ